MINYSKMNKTQKAQYSKANSTVVMLRNMVNLVAIDAEELQAILDLRPSDVFFYLTGKEVGDQYLSALSNSTLDNDELAALQLAKVWQSLKMPIRTMMQVRTVRPNMIARFKRLLKMG